MKLNAYYTPDEPEWYPEPNDPMTRWDKKTEKWYLDLYEGLMDEEGNDIPNYCDIVAISGPDEMDIWIQTLCIEMPSEEMN